VVALAGAGVASAAAASVWFEPTGGWRRVIPVRPWYVALGTAVALLLPLASGDPAVLLYSLPWGIGLAAAGWLCGRAAVTAAWTVAGSAVLYASFLVIHLLAVPATPAVGD
jgi:hypothetical protein